MSAATIEERAQLEIVLLPINELTPGFDFRLDDDPEALTELARSIAELGVLQPLTVRRLGTRSYEVSAGRRRLAAARQAGLDVVPCIVRNLSIDAAKDIAIAENLHRRILSPIEEALAYAHLRDSTGLNHTEIAKRVGRSQPHVSMLLRLLTLPEDLRAAVHAGRMSYTTALKPYRATGTRQGGKDNGGGIKGGDAELVSHWRRRHDRLLAGLYQLLKLVPGEYQVMIDRLLKIDTQPLPEAAGGWETFVGKGRTNGGRT